MGSEAGDRRQDGGVAQDLEPGWRRILLERCLRPLPPRQRGRAEYHLRRLLRKPHALVFNGQRFRSEVVDEIVTRWPTSAVFESGTFRGATTEHLGRRTGVPVHSSEINPEFHAFAAARLAGMPRIHLHLGSSTDVLPRLAQDRAFPRDHVFFYLDAHWGSYLPLQDELALILGHWRACPIMIDDFEVPDDPGYGFDDYGAGKRLSLSYLQPFAGRGLHVFFPAAPSSAETGRRRGCVVLADSEALCGRLREARTLRYYGPLGVVARA